ncbi:DNA repair protein RAD51 homolog 3-like [Dreissena polymorpha]|uniref:DNA repair protein RAD51 homolog 3 n=1 Tax=Dreissena polymorpha TaxID=45954 RepID=A0A9D4MLA8_DREPO|nr:DNA repair protein RAD51 homolog 3-like [Dreissena polymorpha]XP_052271178.1 DNA repair protein RAD51 homolog 3-like [Dreissena polymorpha]KAH3877511.1 hypothetical protein DPMN_001384 [Dreissena polymorpha]
MESRAIHTLALAPMVKTRLHIAGYKTIGDVWKATRSQLCKDTGLAIEEVESVWQVIENVGKNLVFHTGNDLLQKEDNRIAIMTFSERLDTALGGGVQGGTVTEICGLPGTGKTQLCMQLACDVQIPRCLGGQGAEALYIDTQGGLVMERLTEVVSATVAHCRQIAIQDEHPEMSLKLSSLSIETMLAGVHVHRCTSHLQLLAIIEQLQAFLKANRKVRLVIIDSVSFHFRHDFEDLSLRTRILTNSAQTLHKIARSFDIPVVVTNQMTTRVHQGPGQKGSSVVPCLGESWGHACGTRLLLQWNMGTRQAFLLKSPSLKSCVVPFLVTKDGIRDHVPSIDTVGLESAVDATVPNTLESPFKRQKLT